MSILSTSPNSSPQRVQDRQSGGMDVFPMPGFFAPSMQVPPMPGQKPSRDGGARNSGGKPQRAAQGGRGAAAKQPQQAAPPVGRNNAITHQPPPWKDVYTVMMRNLPNKYSQQMLLEELQLNKFQLQSEIDFFYLPMDHYSAVNLGYCFINFVDPCVANAFAAVFGGRRMRHFNSQKTIMVMPASMQGFDKNYAYYSNTRVAQAEDPQYRPIFTRTPHCQEVPQFQSVPAVMWPAQQPGPTYAEGWNMQWPPQPYPGAVLPQGPAADAECRRGGACHSRQLSDCSADLCTASFLQDECNESKQADVVCSPSHSQHLRIRNTFLAATQRSPSVERALQRECKSAPVSAPHSAAGSVRIELEAQMPSGLDFAVVAAASCLAKDLGCIAVQQATGSASSGSTTADSERDAASAPRQPSGSSCGSADLPSDVTVSDVGCAPALGVSQLPSKGSALHQLGNCKPCAFFCSVQGGPPACKNGVECTFCHLCEPGEKKRRKQEKRSLRTFRLEPRR